MLWKRLFELTGWVQLENKGRVGEPGECWSGGREKTGQVGVLVEDLPRVGVPREDWPRGIPEEDLAILD